MRVIPSEEITRNVEKMCLEANVILPEDTYRALRKSIETETDERAKRVLTLLENNAQIAKERKMAICQDTGMAVFFVEWGQEVHISGQLLQEAIDEGVRRAYREGYFRMSVVGDPFERINTGDNTPSIVHIIPVKGDQFKIHFAPKGFGSENMSGIKMLKPADGKEGAKQFLKELLLSNAANACPPLVIGMGIGGTMEKAALMAKFALFRETGKPNPDERIAILEQEWLQMVNSLGIGPQGYGGKITALSLHIETYPTHIAGLPVAVNLNCHVARHKTMSM